MARLAGSLLPHGIQREAVTGVVTPRAQQPTFTPCTFQAGEAKHTPLGHEEGRLVGYVLGPEDVVAEIDEGTRDEMVAAELPLILRHVTPRASAVGDPFVGIRVLRTAVTLAA